MKYILFLLVLFYSCHSIRDNDNFTKNKSDTFFTKEAAKEELARLRTSVTDSNFAVLLDAGLQIQTVEYALQMADTSSTRNGVADSLIVNDGNGQLLYLDMMKAYQLALQHAINQSDVSYYKTQLGFSQNAWLNSKFGAKKTYEALIAIFLLKKDAMIISMIVNNGDNESERNTVEEQYGDLIRNMEKAYSVKAVT